MPSRTEPNPMQPTSVQLSVKHPAPDTPQPASLLDSLSLWLDTPELAYSFWIHSQEAFEDSSRVVYCSMFGRFCQWLRSEGIRLDHCSEKDIKKFLATENPNLPLTRQNRENKGRQKQQYVRMLERVYVHLGTLGFTGQNPGRKAAYERAGAGSDKPSRFLRPAERDAVIGLVESKIDEIRKDEKKLDRWMEVRDLALIGATIGGGMKAQHLKSLTLNCTKLDEGVIDVSTSAVPHRASLLPFALNALALWIEVLEALTSETLSMKGRVGGTSEQWRKSQTVFIADRSINGFGLYATTQRMHPSTIFRRIKKFLTEAGISGERASAQTLRNTYAALLIESGATNEELVTCLGLATDLTAQRIRVMVSGRTPALPVAPADEPLREQR